MACALQCIQTHAPTLPSLFMPGVTCLWWVMATLCYLGPDVNVALSSAHHLVRFPLIWRVHGVVVGWEGYHEGRSNSTPRQTYSCSAQSQSPTSQGLPPLHRPPLLVSHALLRCVLGPAQSTATDISNQRSRNRRPPPRLSMMVGQDSFFSKMSLSLVSQHPMLTLWVFSH